MYIFRAMAHSKQDAAYNSFGHLHVAKIKAHRSNCCGIEDFVDKFISICNLCMTLTPDRATYKLYRERLNYLLYLRTIRTRRLKKATYGRKREKYT